MTRIFLTFSAAQRRRSSTFAVAALGLVCAVATWSTGVRADGAMLAALQTRICGAAFSGSANPGAPIFAPHAADPAAPWAAKLRIVEQETEDGARVVANCGAAALDHEWLITAAHCVAESPWLRIEATLGAQNVDDPQALRRVGVAAFCHARFDRRTLAYDLALIRLDRPLPPSFPVIAPAYPEEAATLLAGDAAFAAGWARASAHEISPVMRKTDLVLVETPSPSDPRLVAAPLRDESSLCVGESGGPLVARIDGEPRLIGVFSSVDAVQDPATGALVELCDGFEARSYFTSVGAARAWLDALQRACAADPALCDPRLSRRPASHR